MRSTWDRGVCVISIDTELAWGLAHRRDGGTTPSFDQERDVIRRLLELFERYEVPSTWAIVGHLFLESCSTERDRPPHPDVLRPDYGWLDDDWFGIDPLSDITAAPDHYGADIVRQIQACPVRQEIASHSFSHMIMDDPGCTPDVLSSELAASKAAAGSHGVELRSFVYPRNACAHQDRLAAEGFATYRGHRPAPAFAGLPRWQRRALGVVDRVRPLRGSAVWPEVEDSGLVNVAQTYLFAPDVKGRTMPARVWARVPAARVRQAASERSLCHLWFHPYNITASPARAFAALEVICRTMAHERDRGRLDLLTMAEVGELTARGASHTTVKKSALYHRDRGFRADIEPL